MITKKQIAYTLRMNVVNLVRNISGIWFTVRFAFYKWYYKGGQNIPPHVIGKLLTPMNEQDSKAMCSLIDVHIAIKEVCKKIGIDYEQTQLFLDFSLMVQGQLEDATINEELERILNSEHKRRAVYMAMNSRSDIPSNKLGLVALSGSWDEFYEWLDQPVKRS